MAFPIIPKKRSGASGYPTTLQVGELAVNTLNGELYLGGDSAVMLLNGPVAAGSTVTEHTGDGTTTAFTFAGYNGTDDGGYLVSVGGIDQPPSKYSITSTAGGTITFVEAPVDGELISVRALVAGSGGGGSGDATSLQGRDIATTAPTDGQVLAWNATTSKWEPTSINGSVSFNAPGSYSWTIPAWVRWAYVSASSGDGSNGTATNGQDGEYGVNAYLSDGVLFPSTTGAVGANGTDSEGIDGKSVTISAVSLNLIGGTKGAAGTPGYGGGGGGGAGFGSPGDEFYAVASPGGAGSGPYAGQGGLIDGTGGVGGGTAQNGGSYPTPYGGSGANFGGDGGIGNGGGGGGGGGDQFSGGGGGAGGGISNGLPGKGGTADTSVCAGGAGNSFADPVDFSALAGTTISIVISEGAGDASITITY